MTLPGLSDIEHAAADAKWANEQVDAFQHKGRGLQTAARIARERVHLLALRALLAGEPVIAVAAAAGYEGATGQRAFAQSLGSQITWWLVEGDLPRWGEAGDG